LLGCWAREAGLRTRLIRMAIPTLDRWDGDVVGA
jgi:hypothetical protein